MRLPAMAQQHYPTREIVVQESIVRALTVVYLLDAVGDEAAGSSLDQTASGFVWTRDLALDLDPPSYLPHYTPSSPKSSPPCFLVFSWVISSSVYMPPIRPIPLCLPVKPPIGVCGCQ